MFQLTFCLVESATKSSGDLSKPRSPENTDSKSKAVSWPREFCSVLALQPRTHRPDFVKFSRTLKKREGVATGLGPCAPHILCHLAGKGFARGPTSVRQHLSSRCGKNPMVETVNSNRADIPNPLGPGPDLRFSDFLSLRNPTVSFFHALARDTGGRSLDMCVQNIPSGAPEEICSFFARALDYEGSR